MSIDWKNAKTHRDPKWPIGGYAPGDYMGKCKDCEQQFLDMDKRAYQCFPCAVEGLQASVILNRQACQKAEQDLRTLKAAIQIVKPL